MPIVEELMQPGSFTVDLDPATPIAIQNRLRDLCDGTVDGGPGYLVIVPTRDVDPRYTDDASILALAAYSGLIESCDGTSLTGVGLAALLGKDQGTGPIFTAPLTWFAAGGAGADYTGQLANWMGLLFPQNGLTLNSVATGGPEFFEVFQYVTARHALDKIVAALGHEYRIYPSGVVDVNTAAVLFPTTVTPEVLVTRADGGREASIIGLTVDTLTKDVDNTPWTSELVLVAEGEGEDTVVATAINPSIPFVDWAGDPLVMQRLVDSPATQEDEQGAVSVAALAQFETPKRVITVSVATTDARRYVRPGDGVYVHAPDLGLGDGPTGVRYRAEGLLPIIARVRSMTWPATAQYAYFLRTAPDEYFNLTPYLRPEDGATTLVVGDLPVTEDLDLVLPTSTTGPVASHAIRERTTRNRAPRGLVARRTPGGTFNLTATPALVMQLTCPVRAGRRYKVTVHVRAANRTGATDAIGWSGLISTSSTPTAGPNSFSVFRGDGQGYAHLDHIIFYDSAIDNGAGVFYFHAFCTTGTATAYIDDGTEFFVEDVGLTP